MDGCLERCDDGYALHCGLSVAAPAPQEEKPPSQPMLGELTASRVTPESVQLEWSVPEGTFDSFTVQYRDAQGQPESLPVDGGSRTVTVPGLSPSRRYNFYLYGVLGQKRVGPVSLDTMTGEGVRWIRPRRLRALGLEQGRSLGGARPGPLGLAGNGIVSWALSGGWMEGWEHARLKGSRDGDE